MLELSTEVSLNLLGEAYTHCTKLLSKVCIKQRLEALVYICGEAHIDFINLFALFLCNGVPFDCV